ncbi:hypothetical protein OPV22_029445 [Ensete ventricosum]|uniref:Pentacotripeptide-repeat region of PRORP domain-containing protein n=1 Tax=Ensete ventricosum TaxID=4639 RepID=A0AAV8QB73_ENSVE|nr:hypothetical protein OPV22_029445 [Ensete ventricosum]
MLPSSLRFLAKIPSLIIQIRGFGSPFPLSKPHPLPPPPILDSEAVLEAVCINLRRRDWKFLQQFSSYLVGPLVRRVILRCRSSPRLSLDFFNWALVQQRNDERSSLDLDTYSVLIHVLVSARMFDETLRIMRQLMQERHVAALELLDALARCRKRYGGSRDVYDAMVRGCTQIGATKDACLVMETLRARGVWVSLHAYNNLLSHLLMSSQDGGVAFWEMYKEMLALGNGCMQEAFRYYNQCREEKLVKDVVPYNSLINHLCKQGRVYEVKQLLGRMFVSCLAPDVVTYSTLIDRFFKDGKIDDALKVYDEMIEVGQRPNLITYNSIIHGFCEVECVDMARLAIEELRSSGMLLDVITYNTVVNGYLRSQRDEEALDLCKDMQQLGIAVNGVTCNIFMNYLCKFGYFEQAKGLLRIMLDGALIPDQITYTTIITAFSKSSQANEIIELHDNMVLRGVSPDEYTYNTIVSCLIQGKAHSKYQI